MDGFGRTLSWDGLSTSSELAFGDAEDESSPVGQRILAPAKQTRSTQIRQARVANQKLDAQLAILRVGGIESSRKQLFVSSSFREIKRSLSMTDPRRVERYTSFIEQEQQSVGRSVEESVAAAVAVNKAKNVFLQRLGARKSQETEEAAPVRLLKGKLTQTICDDEDDSDNPGYEAAYEIHVSLVVGDWHTALTQLSELDVLEDEDLAAALDFRDHENNSLMHLAVMEPTKQVDLRTEDKTTVRKAVRFAESEGQAVREKLLEALFTLKSLFLVEQNSAGLTPLECCTSPILKEHVRMLVRKRHAQKAKTSRSVIAAIGANKAKNVFLQRLGARKSKETAETVEPPASDGALADDDSEEDVAHLAAGRQYAKTPGGFQGMLNRLEKARSTTSMSCSRATTSMGNPFGDEDDGSILMQCVMKDSSYSNSNRQAAPAFQFQGSHGPSLGAGFGCDIDED